MLRRILYNGLKITQRAQRITQRITKEEVLKQKFYSDGD